MGARRDVIVSRVGCFGTRPIFFNGSGYGNMGNLLDRGCRGLCAYAFLIAAVLLLALPVGVARAETVPATISGQWLWKVSNAADSTAVVFLQLLRNYEQTYCIPGTTATTQSGAVFTRWGGYVPALSDGSQVEPSGTSTGPIYSLNCYTTKSGAFAGWQIMTYGIKRVSVAYTCPDASYTLTGSSCTRTDCAANEFRDPTQGYACRKICSDKIGVAAPSQFYATTVGSVGTLDGCQIKCSKLVGLGMSASWSGSSISTAQTTYFTMTNCTYTGKTAQLTDGQLTAQNYDASPTPTPQKCAVAGMGYVQSSSGVTTCVSPSDAPVNQRPETATVNNSDSATSTTDPSGNSTTSKSTSVGSDGTVTTTTTETRPASTDTNGNSICPAGFQLIDRYCKKTTTTTTDKNSYCSSNPSDSACTGTGDSSGDGTDSNNSDGSTFSGSCDSDFSCTGDAASCAIAKATNDQNCAYRKGTDPVSTLGDQLLNGTDPEAANLPGSPDKIGTPTDLSHFSYSDSGGSCPPDLQINMAGFSRTISTSDVCNVGGWLGSIGVACALLWAAWFIIGAIKT